MQTIVFARNTGDDELDMRNFLGKDQDIPRADRFKSPYVLFVPGYMHAPPDIRAAGRLSMTVTDKQAEELLTHPTWRFISEDTAKEVDRRATARFAEEMPELAARREVNADQIGPAVEFAPTAPIAPSVLRAENKAVAANATEDGKKD